MQCTCHTTCSAEHKRAEHGTYFRRAKEGRTGAQWCATASACCWRSRDCSVFLLVFSGCKVRVRVISERSDFTGFSIWAGGLFFPEAFLTATRQTTAQKNEWSLEELVIVVDAVDKNTPILEISVQKCETQKGAYTSQFPGANFGVSEFWALIPRTTIPRRPFYEDKQFLGLWKCGTGKS